MDTSVEAHVANSSLEMSLSLLLYVFMHKFIFFMAESAIHAFLG